MSVAHWIIEGVGIEAEKLLPHLDNEKVARKLLKELPKDENLQAIVTEGRFDELDVDEYCFCGAFDSLADLLTFCDISNTITWGDDGDGNSYFYYPPSMPWHRAWNEPETLEEVKHRITRAVQMLTNLSAEEIDTMIDEELYVYGCG